MKKVLITGGTGFIGSNFVHRLSESGFDVNLLVRPESNFWRIESIKNKLKFHNIDILNEKETADFINNLKPRIILHFAAYGAYPGRQKNIKEAVDTNILGTINLLNACSKIDFDCFINTGSNSEYGEKKSAMKEDDILGPNNFYGVTKAAGTLYCQYLAKDLSLPVATVRPFAVYGYFEDKFRLVPQIIKSATENKSINLSLCGAVRDFIFIEDVIDLYLKIIEKINIVKGGVINAGVGRQYTLEELAKIVKNFLNSPSEIICGAVSIKQREPKSWVADISKASELLSWKPNFSLEDGLQKTIRWFQKILKDTDWYK